MAAIQCVNGSGVVRELSASDADDLDPPSQGGGGGWVEYPNGHHRRQRVWLTAANEARREGVLVHEFGIQSDKARSANWMGRTEAL